MEIKNCISKKEKKDYKEIELPSYQYDFKSNAVDIVHFPFSVWSKLMREVLSEKDRNLLLATEPQGLYDLRYEIAKYLHHARGIAASPDQIIVGAGSEYLLVLLMQILGDNITYGIENPGYYKIHKIIKSSGKEFLTMPMDEGGLSIDYVKESNVDIIHVTPSHHFPLGIVMPIGRRMELLRWANEGRRRYIIEDDYDSEFRFSGRPIPALKGLDDSEKVIYLSTFTKSLAPSLRISYMVLPTEILRKYKEQFLFYACTVANFEQFTLAKFIGQGYYERHINRMRIHYKNCRDALIVAFEKSALKGKLRFKGGESGIHLLVTVDCEMDEAELVKCAMGRGVRVYGLSDYYIIKNNIPKSTVVLGYGGIDLIKIDDAVKELERAWIK